MSSALDRCPECGVVWNLGRDVGGRVHTPGGLDCLHRQLAAARAEADRLRKQYEALRVGVERVACQVRDKAMDAWDAWDEGCDPHDQGRAHGLEQAEQILRALFDEVGGVKRD